MWPRLGVRLARFSTVFSVFVILMTVQAAVAFDLTPTVSTIELPGDQSGTLIAVNNPRDEDLPVTFEIVERTVLEDGTEDQTPADETFLIFPPQAVIPAGKSQTIRVRWLGSPPRNSRSFTLYAAEVPVDLSEIQESGVQTVWRMGASVHVTAETATAAPVLDTAASQADGTMVTIRNDGDRFVYIDDLTLEIGGQTISGPDLAVMAGRTLVPPSRSRTFLIPDHHGEPVLRFDP